MKRSGIFNFLIGIAMLGCVDAYAQPWQNFYPITTPPPGTGYAPGRANAITHDLAGNAYVTAGSATDPSNNNYDAFSIAQYDYTGNNIWTSLLEPDHTVYTNCEGNDVCELGGQGFAYVGYMWGPGGNASVLIITDLAGNYLAHSMINKERVAAVAYDQNLNRIAVLGQEVDPFGTMDYYLQFFDINANPIWPGGVSIYGTPHTDIPHGLMYDITDQSFVMTGSSIDPSGDFQTLTIKVDQNGSFIWGATVGDPTTNEVARGVSIALNGNDYVVTGSLNTAAAVEPFLMELDKNTGTVNYYKSYPLFVFGNNLSYSVTPGPNNRYYLVGWNRTASDANGFLLRVNNLGNAVFITYYGQLSQPGDEMLFDITPNPNTGEFALVGNHRFGGIDYPWVINTLNDGRANCYDEADLMTNNVPYIVGPAAPQGLRFPDCCVSLTPLQAFSSPIDECSNPFKSGDGSESSGLFGSFNESVSPQPATNTITLRYELPQGNGGSWILRDVLGREIMTQSLAAGSKELNVSVSKLESGVYFYEYVVNGNIVAQNKLLIAR